jgi:transcriptional regulator GlxA family with amidase domain
MAIVRSIRLLTYPGAALLDIAAPLQAFRSAAAIAEGPGAAYQISVVSVEGGPVRTAVGMTIDTAPFEPRPADTFLIPGGSDSAVDAACSAPGLLDYVRAQAGAARRVGAMGPGAFVLVRAGLLRKRRVAAHWSDAAKFKDYPDTEFVTDAFVVDGKYWTSGGMLSAADLALAMIENDFGRAAANQTARHLVAQTRRVEGDPQMSLRGAGPDGDVNRIRQLMLWIVANPAADLSTTALASQARLSVRSLHRHFAAETGDTPARFVERARFEAAKRLLLTTDWGLQRIAATCGFGSASVMHAAFVRLAGMSPSKLRKGTRGA